MLSDAQIVEVMKLVAADNTEDMWWKTDKDGNLHVYVNVSDFFVWGCSDVEEITSQEDIEGLRKAFEDSREFAETVKTPRDAGGYVSREDIAKVSASIHWPELWAARKRGMRPQGAIYPYLKGIESLFDAAGPERDIDVLNPKDQQGNYKYKKVSN